MNLRIAPSRICICEGTREGYILVFRTCIYKIKFEQPRAVRCSSRWLHAVLLLPAMATVPVVVTQQTGVKRSRISEETSDSRVNEEPILYWFGENHEHISGSAPATETPQMIRIGLDKHGYIYSRVMNTLYKCCRGSDNCPTGHKLWLYKFTGFGDFQWIAYDTPDHDNLPPMEPPATYNPDRIFSSIEDIVVEGRHSWRIYAGDGRESTFMTTVL